MTLKQQSDEQWRGSIMQASASAAWRKAKISGEMKI